MRLAIALVTMVLASTSAAAEPVVRARAAANQKAPRTKAPAARVAPKESSKPLPIPTSALLVQYQRVGRELLVVANERRALIGVETQAAKLSCAELLALFRSIKIDDAVKTAQSRAAAAAVLADLHEKVERLRGVELTQDCLNNPLAKDCT